MFFPLPDSNHHLAILFFLQIAVLLLTCRGVGLIAKRLGQPQVVAEMVAGVLLGPSLFGWLAPELHARLFPKPSLTIIYVVAQVALSVYMFLVGLEFDLGLIRSRIRSAASVSIAGILTPFALGAGLALLLCGDTTLFAAEIRPWEAVLFMGSAMSITAFPMLARIIYERGMSGTPLGTLALAAGSADDAAAWCLFAIVLASFGGSATIAIAAIGGGVAYALVCLVILRPLLRRLGDAADRTGGVSPGMFTLVLALLMLGSWYTDAIGIYSVFGAFILGVAMPRGIFAHRIQRLAEPLTTGLLLPLFFVYSGLNTSLGLVNTPRLWLLAGIVLAAACIGKGVACWAAARVNGEPPREAMAIGALMNARGLMELILLNIGYERGVITQSLFSIMVVMAVATTLLATPVFELVYGRHRRRAEAVAPDETTRVACPLL